MPFGAHVPELLAVILLALLIFGPKKLPELGSSIGKTIKEFQKGVREVADPIKEEVADPIKEVEESLRLPPPSAPALPPPPTPPVSTASTLPSEQTAVGTIPHMSSAHASSASVAASSGGLEVGGERQP